MPSDTVPFECQDAKDCTDDIDATILECDFTDSEIKLALDHLKRGKSPGNDGIIVEILTCCTHIILHKLTWIKPILSFLEEVGDCQLKKNGIIRTLPLML